MKKIAYMFVLLVLFAGLIPTTAWASAESGPEIAGLPATVVYGQWMQGKNSILDITLTGIPDGSALSNGVYAGWCIQDHITGQLKSEPALLYSSLDAGLPADLESLPWNQINYVLNHKVRGAGKSDLEFFKDVQTAIWLLLGEPNPNFGVSPEAQQMMEQASANPNYVPGDGEVMAVIVYSDGMSTDDPHSVQETIIEVRRYLPTSTPTSTATYTATSTFTETPTETQTATPTATFTPTNTFTATPTATGTLPTDTPTFTPTNTSTFTPTMTGTLPTDTPTFTPTNTFTATPTMTGTLPTDTPTFTPTGEACVPNVVTSDFSRVNVGTSVEGMDKVIAGLDINAKGTAVRILEGKDPFIYGAKINGVSVNNAGVVSGGFGDPATQKTEKAPQYTFTFAPGTSVSEFSLHMLDFGDYNPTESKKHLVTMTAYDASGVVVSKHELSYPSNGDNGSSVYGNLLVSGDAVTASPGQPGNWTWHVAGEGIAKVTLVFGAGYDPNVGFDLLSFTTGGCGVPNPTPTFTPSPTPTATQSCQSMVTSDFSRVNVGTSVEGMGKVVPDLDINAKGTAVRILEGKDPFIYGAKINGVSVNNAGISFGGFGDPATQKAEKAPQYTFTFAPGTSVSEFSLHMLDFGDYNPTESKRHVATMTAYDASGAVVSKHELSYPSNGDNGSSVYGNLLISGDAITASPGQPGNWTWRVTGEGIVKVVLTFGSGYDPNVGFELLSFAPAGCQ